MNFFCENVASVAWHKHPSFCYKTANFGCSLNHIWGPKQKNLGKNDKNVWKHSPCLRGTPTPACVPQDRCFLGTFCLMHAIKNRRIHGNILHNLLKQNAKTGACTPNKRCPVRVILCCIWSMSKAKCNQNPGEKPCLLQQSAKHTGDEMLFISRDTKGKYREPIAQNLLLQGPECSS